MSYWKRRNIIEVEGKSLFTGHYHLFFADKEKTFTRKLGDFTKSYGKTYGIYQGLNKIIVTNDLDIISEVFVKQFENFHGRQVNPFVGDPEKEKMVHMFFARGARWKRLRALASPAFTNANLKKIHETVEDSALEMVKLLDKVADKEINIRDYFNEYTMDIICRVSMGQTESKMFKNPYFFDVDYTSFFPMMAYCGLIPSFLIKLSFMIGAMIPNSEVDIFLKLTDKIGKAVEARIKQREDDEKRGIEKGEPSDFIDMFLDAKVDELPDEGGEEYSRANVSSIDYDTLGRLKYLEAVFKETLRVYPLAASANARECTRTTTAAGLRIEKGESVMTDTWTLHHDKNLWGPDADEFVPERWLNKIPHPQGAYLPFGAGPRMCIGMRLAYIEEKVALCHILRKYDIAEGPNTGEELNLRGTALVHPTHVKVILKTRN
ncbi:hypothetical protein WR25_10837 isoform A [Diploscapter pachys]|uniref:Cytochrome P450 n=2 Tax=Diploscapter pachys TaxID=2018661 RepID=A0A2A2JAX4_9BILA|nr:hypothetical protein WR25_10837 isoform A [Diploscapter pachys]